MEDISAIDPSYEYNAPQFVDFKHLDKGASDENLDDYFNFDHEAGEPVGIAESFSEDISIYEDAATSRQNTPRSAKKNTPAKKTPAKKETPRRRNTPRSCRSTPSNIPSPAPGTGKENDVPDVLTQKMAVLKKVTGKDVPNIKPVLSNICMDITAWRNKGASAPSQHTMKAKRKSLRNSAGSGRTRNSLEEVRATHKSPLSKKLKRSNSAVLQKPSNKTTEDRPLKARTRTASVDNRPVRVPKKETPKAATAKRGRTQSVEHVPLRGSASVEKKKGAPRSGSAGPARNHRRTASASNSKVRSASASSTDSKVGSAKRNTSANRGRGNNSSLNGSAEGVKMLKPMLTIPSTPSFMKRKPITSGNNMKSTEQMELERIKELRKDLARKRKIAEESYKTAKSASSYVPAHSSTKVTKPMDIKFATDDRIKEHPMSTRQDTGPKDFTAMLRHQSPEAHHKPLQPTKPVPFHFMEKKRKREEEESGKFEFKSVAEKMIAFARKTPDRFRTKGKNHKVNLVSGPPPKLTIAKTPILESRKRHRPVATKSHAEMEEEEAEEIKRYKFHAQPFNEEILKGPTGVKRAERRELTKPMEFELETDRRLQYRHEHTKSLDEKDEIEKHIHPKGAVPHHGIPFMPKYDHKVTETKPFSFDEKDRRRFTQKEMKIHQIVEEERRKASEFKAKPLRDLSPQLPPKKVIPATHPEPFHLHVDARGQHKAEDWSHKIEEELRQQRAAANFKARPNAVVHQKPFMPQKSNKPLTDVGDVELATDRRAEEREEYERFRHEKEVEMELQRKMMERMKEEEERRKAEEQRAAAVHRAHPVRKYKRVEVKPSDQPLTQPKTPRFSSRLKTRV